MSSDQRYQYLIATRPKTYLFGFSGPKAAYSSHDFMWLLNCLNYSGLRVPIVPVNEPTAERCMIHVSHHGPVG